MKKRRLLPFLCLLLCACAPAHAEDLLLDAADGSNLSLRIAALSYTEAGALRLSGRFASLETVFPEKVRVVLSPDAVLYGDLSFPQGGTLTGTWERDHDRPLVYGGVRADAAFTVGGLTLLGSLHLGDPADEDADPPEEPVTLRIEDRVHILSGGDVCALHVRGDILLATGADVRIESADRGGWVLAAQSLRLRKGRIWAFEPMSPPPPRCASSPMPSRWTSTPPCQGRRPIAPAAFALPLRVCYNAMYSARGGVTMQSFSSFFQMLLPASGRDALSIVFSICLSIVIALIIAQLYKYTHRGLNYELTFMKTLVMLAPIVTSVMLFIRGDLVLSLGLIGSLSIIRFRTPIKDTRDMVFIFWVISVGLGCGTYNWAVVIITAILLSVLTILLHVTRYGRVKSRDFVLVLSGSGPMVGEQVSRVFAELSGEAAIRSQEIDGADWEVVYELRLAKVNAQISEAMLAQLRGISGVQKVSLLAPQIVLPA